MSTESTGIRISNNTDESQYTADLDGRNAGVAAYERSGDTIVFTHTVVDEDLEGQGVGSTLIQHALDDAREQQLTVVPQCEFVAAFISEHAEYQDLVG
jgi:predicted GNAT family acetyltransferase